MLFAFYLYPLTNFSSGLTGAMSMVLDLEFVLLPTPAISRQMHLFGLKLEGNLMEHLTQQLEDTTPSAVKPTVRELCIIFTSQVDEWLYQLLNLLPNQGSGTKRTLRCY